MFRRASIALTLAAALVGPVSAQNNEGVTDTEIKLGQTIAYSGPASVYGMVGKVTAAYFEMINDQGGIHGRKVNLVSLDDGFSPPKTVEMTRRLIEQDKVMALFGSTGSTPNSAVQPYLNEAGVPQIIALGAAKFADPEKYPWTISLMPDYDVEGSTLARYALAQKPEGKIAILYQNDDAGRDLRAGFKRQLGDKTSMIAGEAGYELSEPSIRAQMAELRASGADVIFVAAIPKFVALAVREMTNTQWKPLVLLPSMGQSVETALAPAGLENSIGAISTSWFKSVSPATEADEAIIAYKTFVEKHVPDAKATDWTVGYAYVLASMMEKLLRDAGPEIGRERLRDVMTNLKGFTVPMMLPGIEINTTPEDYHAYKSMRIVEFDGKEWQLVDETKP